MNDTCWRSNALRLMFLAVAFVLSDAAAAPTVELVVRRANVITVDTNLPRAQAFAVADGKFVFVGSDEAVKPFIGEQTRVLELDGKTVVPGFIDAHAHPGPEYPEDSPWASVDCRPEKVRSIEALIAALGRKAERTPAGQWVTGSRYQETKLGRHPTRWDLDRASTNHPIIISHSSGHQSVCNSLALQLAGVTRDTADPAGGKFVRDERGELTGLLQERAASVIRGAGPRRPAPPAAETLAAYRAGLRRYLNRGLTSVHVAGTSPGSAAMLEHARADDLPLGLYVMLRESSIEEAVRRKASATNAGVRYGAIKLFHGNSLSGQTCWLSKPYERRPDYFGVPPARTQAELNALILRVHEAGLQACVHSNGDREIEMVLDAFENALKQKPRADHRHRIEHCSVVTEPLLRRIKELGLVVVPHSYVWEHGDKMENYGAWRWDWMHPARSLIDHGIPMAGHSDDPVSVADPLLRIQDMVTRRSAEGKVYGAKQRVTVAEALHAWTLGGAFASFEEREKGSITVGKQADFVVLSSDPTKVAPERIRRIAVEKTFVAGRAVAGSDTARVYRTNVIEGWTVLVDTRLLEHEAAATERALELLQNQLREMVRVAPASAVEKLRGVTLWFSPEYANARPRAEYHPGAGWLRENGRNPAMVKGVEFTDIANFEAESRRMPNFTLHELAHAFHDQALPGGFANAEIKAAFDRARQRGSYERVARWFGNGRSNTVERAYAMTNPMEYFAEGTEAFFSRNDFYPFTRAELKQHDPELEELLAKLWGAER